MTSSAALKSAGCSPLLGARLVACANSGWAIRSRLNSRPQPEQEVQSQGHQDDRNVPGNNIKTGSQGADYAWWWG